MEFVLGKIYGKNYNKNKPRYRIIDTWINPDYVRCEDTYGVYSPFIVQIFEDEEGFYFIDPQENKIYADNDYNTKEKLFNLYEKYPLLKEFCDKYDVNRVDCSNPDTILNNTIEILENELENIIAMHKKEYKKFKILKKYIEICEKGENHV